MSRALNLSMTVAQICAIAATTKSPSPLSKRCPTGAPGSYA